MRELFRLAVTTLVVLGWLIEPGSIALAQDSGDVRPELVYLRDDGVWAVYANGDERLLTPPERNVLAFDYAYDRDTLAYVLVEDDMLDAQTAYLVRNAATLPEAIAHFEPSLYGEQWIAIRDIGFSDDETLLAISYSDGMKIYDMESGTLRDFFTRPRETPDAFTVSGVFGYVDPRFSPDNSRVVMRALYWEGIGEALVERSGFDLTQDVVFWPPADEPRPRSDIAEIIDFLLDNRLVARWYTERNASLGREPAHMVGVIAYADAAAPPMPVYSLPMDARPHVTIADDTVYIWLELATDGAEFHAWTPFDQRAAILYEGPRVEGASLLKGRSAGGAPTFWLAGDAGVYRIDTETGALAAWTSPRDASPGGDG